MLHALNVLNAHDRSRELQAEAARRRLARIVTCCRPSTLAIGVARLRARLLRPRPEVACCA